MSRDDVTQWITDLAEGDESAAQRIWDRYYGQLVRLARRKLRASRRRAADEEDVVLSAFQSFCQAAEAGRFPRLKDRHDLWKLLVTITARKAVSYLRREQAKKRGEGAVRGESAFLIAGSSVSGHGIGQVLGREPSPEFAAEVMEQFDQLLNQLEEESLREVALLKCEGYTNVEVARKLNCAVGTVERKLMRIRKAWSKEAEL